MIEFIKRFFHELRTKDKCFSEHKNKNNICYGMHGGDNWSDNHSYQCLDCPHFTLLHTENNKVIDFLLKGNKNE